MWEQRQRRTLSQGEPHATIDRFVRSQPRTASYHASGKEALRVGLSLLSPSERNEILLPSYLPKGVVEAVHAAGYTPRFYPVESPFELDTETVERHLSDETAAIVAVQYFGFPHPRLRELRKTARKRDVALVDDSSHGPLSVSDGRALGTVGDIGFASFHKPLNVPDGAVLYVDESSPLVDLDGSIRARERDVETWRPRPQLRDVRHHAAATGSELSRRVPQLQEPLRRTSTAVERLSGIRQGTSTTRDAPAAWRGEMMWTTHRAVQTTDPDAVRRARRSVYRAWMSASTEMRDAEPMVDTLPSGVCPWMFPVHVDGDADRFVDRVRSRVGGVFTWPRVPREVSESDAYPAAIRLSETVVCLPLHRHVDEATVHRIAREGDL